MGRRRAGTGGVLIGVVIGFGMVIGVGIGQIGPPGELRVPPWQRPRPGWLGVAGAGVVPMGRGWDLMKFGVRSLNCNASLLPKLVQNKYKQNIQCAQHKTSLWPSGGKLQGAACCTEPPACV